jgi:acetolactate synthase-1/3 small subunit
MPDTTDTTRADASNASTIAAVPTRRSGQSDVALEEARTHTVVISVEDRPGSVDRVVGVLRRRRANMQTLTIGQGEQPDVKRITAIIVDSEVEAEHLIEQLRKIVDVCRADIIQPQQTIVRELALIKVNSPTPAQELLELGQTSGATVVDRASDFVTFEVTGSAETIEQFVARVQSYGIREIARSGSVVITRTTTAQ